MEPTACRSYRHNGHSVNRVAPSAVTVVFDDGVQRQYDVVVGADGVHSTIRGLAFGRPPPHYVGQVSWRFLSEYAHGITNWTVMLGRGRAFLTVPVPGGLYLLRGPDVRAHRESRERHCDLAFAVFGLRYAGGAILDRLVNADAVHFAPIEEVTVEPSATARIVLIGDAAHTTWPNWPRARAWPSRMPSSSARCSRRADAAAIDCSRFPRGVGRESSGCSSARIGGIASGRFLRS